MKISEFLFKTILLVFGLCSISKFVVGQSDAFSHYNNLWIEYNSSKTDSVRIRLLGELSFLANYVLDEQIRADSISKIALKIAKQSKSTSLEIIALNNYIESVDVERLNRKALECARTAIRLSHNFGNLQLEWKSTNNLVTIMLSGKAWDSAYTESRKLMKLAEKLGSKADIAKSYLAIGMSLEGQVKMMDALDNFLNAQRLSELIDNKQVLKMCYSQLADFYNRIKTFDKSIEYKQKQQVILLAYSHPVDSVELMWTQNQKHIILSRYNNLLNDKDVEMVIDFALRTNNLRLKNYEFSIYRKHLIEDEKIDELYRVYNVKYPGELRILYSNDPGTYYRLKAFFKDREGQYDSACYYFGFAEKWIISNPNLLFRSNFYMRFGQFLRRIGKNNEAISAFSKAYFLAKSDSLFGKLEFMHSASGQLCSLYVLVKDYKQAYVYSEKMNSLNDDIFIISNKEKANRMWLEYQIKLDNEKRDIQLRQQRNERNMMGGGVVLLLIITLLVFRNYQNQKRLNKLLDAAKKKSEDLLLNILPFETAEELKVYGKAKAKQFDEVTVMFTDFKDFTQVSEKLSAEELVEKIHTYFSEFDRIIEKHGIEKIKIIGDSYMCVGGLPVVNLTHAFDVVSAALELQQFMNEQKTQRLNKGQTFFELRIGIHTGPVIAGIVGIKKFAYDIWGDTVNTASRMENSGEINKVNISGSTYERVKDKFSCTHRGKISAKHKGEIDMYFVDSSKE